MNVTIRDFQITAFDQGINLYPYSNDTIVANNVTANKVGIYVAGEWMDSQRDLIYHNNFIDNTSQADRGGGGDTELWDNGYPSGGNYWSDDNSIDLHSGPYQNESGSDGIGDSEYSFVTAAPAWYMMVEDHYPLTTPYGSNLPLACPAAHYTITPLQLFANETTVFNASTSTCTNGTIIRYNWDFGDGNSGVGQGVSHVYSSIGNYTVTLTVISNTRIPNTENQTITVQQAPMPLWETITLIVGGTATIVIVSIAVYLLVKRIRRLNRIQAREHIDKYSA
jgi:PKD repeat protein